MAVVRRVCLLLACLSVLAVSISLAVKKDHSKLGKKALEEKDYDAAIAEFMKVIRDNPSAKEAYFRRSMAYLGKRDFEKALDDANKVIDIGSNSYMEFALRGSVYSFMRDYDRALTDFNEAIRLNPSRS